MGIVFGELLVGGTVVYDRIRAGIEHKQNTGLYIKDELQAAYQYKTNLSSVFDQSDAMRLKNLSTVENIKQGFLKEIMMSFIDRMTDVDPKKRPSALAVSRFFRTMQRYEKNCQVVNSKPKSIDDILLAKGFLVKKSVLAQSGLGLKSRVLMKLRKKKPSLWKVNWKKYQGFSNELKLAMFKEMLFESNLPVLEGLRTKAITNIALKYGRRFYNILDEKGMKRKTANVIKYFKEMGGSKDLDSWVDSQKKTFA